MKTKKKVLFITSSLNLGGAERQLLLLCERLEILFDVEIVSLETEGPLKEKYLLAFPNIFFLNKSNPFVLILQLKKIIRTSRPDVVVTWLYKADLLGGLAAKLAGNIPVVWSARNSSIPHFSKTKRLILRVLSKVIPSKIVANGMPAYNFHITLGYPTKKILLIPNLLAQWTNHTVSNSRLLVKNAVIDKLRIGIAARQVSGKGILEIIKILELLPEGFPEIDLLLVGQHSIESHGWVDNNLYNGHKVQSLHQDSDLAEWFASLDLYLMSSTSWESQPNSLIEAIAIGCPILVSNQIDLDFPIAPQLKFDPTSMSSFQSALNEILQIDSSEIESLISYTRVQTLATLSSEAVQASWIALLNESRVKE
jgi:glycosyltransferase involved in cell wall biosynthesis